MLRIGASTVYGRIGAIGSIGGERYYWCIKAGVVSMIPAIAIEITEEP